MIRKKNRIVFKEKFSNEEFELIKDLHQIRNKAAHVFLAGGYISLDFAVNALTKMAQLMHKLGEKSIEAKIYSLRTQMSKENLFDGKTVIASKETLVRFLDEEVLLKAKNDPRATEIILKKIDETHKQLEELSTGEDVVNWFNPLMNSSRGIDSYTHFNNAGLTTFEDIREKFYRLCFGE
jgi:hypothetical protein